MDARGPAPLFESAQPPRQRSLATGTPGDLWLDDLEALLCDPLALNLQDAIAHGVGETVPGVHAALLLHAACALANLRPASSDRPGRRQLTQPPRLRPRGRS